MDTEGTTRFIIIIGKRPDVAELAAQSGLELQITRLSLQEVQTLLRELAASARAEGHARNPSFLLAAGTDRQSQARLFEQHSLAPFGLNPLPYTGSTEDLEPRCHDVLLLVPNAEGEEPFILAVFSCQQCLQSGLTVEADLTRPDVLTLFSECLHAGT